MLLNLIEKLLKTIEFGRKIVIQEFLIAKLLKLTRFVTKVIKINRISWKKSLKLTEFSLKNTENPKKIGKKVNVIFWRSLVQKFNCNGIYYVIVHPITYSDCNSFYDPILFENFFISFFLVHCPQKN